MLNLSLSLPSIAPRLQHPNKCSLVSSLPMKSLSLSSPKRSVAMMAKRETELTEIRAKTTQEINDEVVDLKTKIFRLRLQKSARDEFKSSEFRRICKRIARMLTVKRERELDEGIGKRLSRKMDRQWKKSVSTKLSQPAVQSGAATSSS